MPRAVTLAILSDIHYAAAAEQARGNDFESRGVANPFLRGLLRNYRRFVWMHRPLAQNQLLEKFLDRAGAPDFVIANGDYSCDAECVGVSDEASFQSARECLDRLRGRFGANVRATFGDHELGKVSLAGGRGVMRLASFQRAKNELGLEPFWKLEIGNYVLLGVVSSLVALPVFGPDTLAAERAGWENLRAAQLAEIRAAFRALKPEQRVLLFCHDPTALPFLWREEIVREKIPQIGQTVIGHLHSNLFLGTARLLAGMPVIGFLGHSVKRMSTALHEARHWRPFNVRLCPALAGIELLKDGGFLKVELDPAAQRPARFEFCPIPR